MQTHVLALVASLGALICVPVGLAQSTNLGMKPVPGGSLVDYRGQTISELPEFKPADSVYQDYPASLTAWAPDPKQEANLGSEVTFQGCTIRPPRSFAQDAIRSRGDGMVWGGGKPHPGGGLEDGPWLTLEILQGRTPKQKRIWVVEVEGNFLKHDSATSLTYTQALKPAISHGTLNGTPFTHVLWQRKLTDGTRVIVVDYFAPDGERWVHVHGEASGDADYYLLQAAARSIKVGKAATTAPAGALPPVKPAVPAAALDKQLGEQIVVNGYTLRPLARLPLDTMWTDDKTAKWSDQAREDEQKVEFSIRTRPHYKHAKPRVLSGLPMGMTEGPVWAISGAKIDEVMINGIAFTRAVSNEGQGKPVRVLHVAYDGDKIVELDLTLKGTEDEVNQFADAMIKTVRKAKPEEIKPGGAALQRLKDKAKANAPK